MKKSLGLLLVLLLACMFSFAAYAGEGDVKIDEEHFPDPVFRKEVEQYDLDHDGMLSPEEADNAIKIRVNGEGVLSLEGIEYLSGLEDLFCNDNDLTKLDISRNTALKTLNCSNTDLTELDVSQNSGLVFLYCDSNHLAALDVSGNPNLQMLSCSDNPIKGLDISNLSQLVFLVVTDCELTKLDLSNNPDLVGLYCRGNQLTKLDLSNNPLMKSLPCDGNKLTALDISNCIIRNHSMAGIVGQGSYIVGDNLLVSCCGESLVCLQYGGRYRFSNSTFANYWRYQTRKTPSVILNNYYQYDETTIFARPLQQADFFNCIIYGSYSGNDNSGEIKFDWIDACAFNCSFRNCLMRSSLVDSDGNATFSPAPNIAGNDLIVNSDPKFKDAYGNNYNLSEDSPAIGAGNSIYLQSALDLNGNPRGNPPTIGAFEYQQ